MPWAIIAGAVHFLGFAAALHAVMKVRTSQGATAWTIALLCLPYVALPLYLVFGRRSFVGYRERLKTRLSKIAPLVRQVRADVSTHAVDPAAAIAKVPGYEALRTLAHGPLTRGNEVELLVDGEATFRSIFAGIDAAKSYVLVEFYIVHDDEVGRALLDRLVAARGRGVRVYFLYDEIGSSDLPDAYDERLRAAGGRIAAFGTRRGRGNAFQINFRNHRKIVVADGEVAWVGGHNVGDEYLGKDRDMSPWRDTHVRIEGPAAFGAQAAFLEDWCWAEGEVLDLEWPLRPATGADREALVFATGPADPLENGKLFFLQQVSTARTRIWIATPYFVPEPALTSALQLAALRDVDVRVLVPRKNDSRMVKFASYGAMQELRGSGVHFRAMRDGFMHQKVMLVDDSLSTIGTHNFDARSMVLNFEVGVLVHDVEFASRVEAMLKADFGRSDPIDVGDLARRPFLFRLAVRIARLTAPIQ